MSMGKHAARREQRHLKFNGRYHSTAMQAVTNPRDPATMILVPRKPKKLTANQIYQAKRREYQTEEAKAARLEEKADRNAEKAQGLIPTPEQKAKDFYATTGGRPGAIDL